MARLHSDHSQRGVDRPDGIARAQGMPCVVYTDAAGTQPANLAAYDPGNPGTPGAAIPGAVLEVDRYSLRPAFWDLDDRDRLWISVNAGPLVPIHPDPQPLIAAESTRITNLTNAVAGKADSDAVSAVATAAAADATAKAAAAAAASLPRNTSKNLFDLSAAQPGRFWQAGNTPVVSANYYASALIPVTPGQQYTINNPRSYQFMNASQQFITGSTVDNPSQSVVTFTVPAGVAYVAYNVGNAFAATSQMEAGPSATSWVPFGFQHDRLIVGGSLLTDTLASVTSTAASAVAAASAAMPRNASKNLFDFSSAQQGKFWQTGSTPVVSPNYYASPLIPVTVGQQYTINNPRSYQFMNASQQYVAGSYVDNSAQSVVTFTVPAGVAYVAYNVGVSFASGSQMEAGGTATSWVPFGYQHDRLIVGGALLTDSLASVTAVASRMPGVTVYRSGNAMLVRSVFDATRDVLMPVNLSLGAEAAVSLISSPPSMQWVTLVPSTTPDAAVWPAITAGTQIHPTGDDIAPIFVGWSHVGGNHGWVSGTRVTMTGHGKTNADCGSLWSDGTRTFTLLYIIDVNNLMFGNEYTVADGVVTGSQTVPSGPLTHVSGATNTATVTISGGAANEQIHPSTYGQTATVDLDGKPVPDGKSAGQVLTVLESYLISSYKGLIDTARATIGTPITSILASVPALGRASNTYRFTQGQLVVAQQFTAFEKCVINLGVTQVIPLALPSGGTRRQHMPGVGTSNGFDFSGNVSIEPMATYTFIQPAHYLNPVQPAASMTQWAYDSGGAPQYGLTVGILPVGDGHPAVRLRNTTSLAWYISNFKKNYPQVANVKPVNPGDRVSGTAYRRYLAPPDTATEITVSDGTNWWAVISRTTTTTGGRMQAPHLLGRRLVPVGPTTLTVAGQVTGEGITYAAPTTPGHGVFAAVEDTPRLETIPGATSGPGSYFVTAVGPVGTLTLTGLSGSLLLSPIYLPEAVDVDRVAIEVTTAGTGVIRHGVYAHDPATGLPVQTGPLHDHGTVDATNTGIKESTIAARLPAGWHWHGVVWQGTATTAPTIRVLTSPTGVGPLNIGATLSLMTGARMGYVATGITGALAAITVPAASAHTVGAARVAYRRA